MTVDRLALGALQTNCYFLKLKDTNEAVIIDPADEGNVIIDKIKKENLSIKYIVLTHAHFDHTGALDSVKQFTNAPIVIHIDESPALSDEKLNLAFVFGSSSQKSKADILVKHNDKLILGKKELIFLHTPGHTKGSMCIRVDDILFSGDTLFYMSMGRTDFPGGNIDEIVRSLSQLMELKQDTIVYPGHGDKTTIGYEKINNPYIR